MTCEHRRRHALSLGSKRVLLGLTIPLVMSTSAFATTLYVDGKNGKYYNSGSANSPLQTFNAALAKARPGDTIYIEPTTTYKTMYVTKGGSSGKPITIAGSGSYSNPTSVNGGGKGFGIWIGASYVNVLNFKVTAPGYWSAFHVPEGVHNVTISHNTAYNSGGNGIDLVGDDYMTVSYNTVYGNAHDTSHNTFGSGISVKGSKDIDNNTGVKITVNGNIAYANTNIPTCSTASCWAKAGDSDGSGIIIDNNRRTYSDHIAYRGRMLVANNVVFGNGGRGIHLYLSDHITVTDNTAFSNNQDYYEGNYRPGEVTGDYVSDVAVYNNVLYSDGKSGRGTGQHVPISFMYCSGSKPITIANNVGYMPQNTPGSFSVVKGNSIAVNVSGTYWGNPQYMRATLDAEAIDLRVKSSSIAMKHGMASQSMSTDILGTTRHSPTTIGAYENPG